MPPSGGRSSLSLSPSSSDRREDNADLVPLLTTKLETTTSPHRGRRGKRRAEGGGDRKQEEGGEERQRLSGVGRQRRSRKCGLRGWRTCTQGGTKYEGATLAAPRGIRATRLEEPCPSPHRGEKGSGPRQSILSAAASQRRKVNGKTQAPPPPPPLPVPASLRRLGAQQHSSREKRRDRRVAVETKYHFFS